MWTEKHGWIVKYVISYYNITINIVQCHLEIRGYEIIQRKHYVLLDLEHQHARKIFQNYIYLEHTQICCLKFNRNLMNITCNLYHQ